MKRPTPLDAPRDFRIDEMFFSTTDRKGKILQGNDVFVRVSGYARNELLGKPHNIIRHPDMPRAVFRLVWAYLERGQPVAGIVKNLASDGRYYWVVALLMPIDGGFLSVRFKPSSVWHKLVEDLYRQMRQGERDAEAGGADGTAAAMAAGEQTLLAALQSQGFKDYEVFMRALLHDELKGRDGELTQGRLELFPSALPSAATNDGNQTTLRMIYDESQKAYKEINILYAQLDELSALNDELGRRSQAVFKRTTDFRFIAFNAALRASRLGQEARSLGVIAEYLGGASDRTTILVGQLSERIASISSKLGAVIFNLAAGRLQIEMLLSFCAELAAAPRADAGGNSDSSPKVHREMIEQLQHAFAGTVDSAVRALAELQTELRDLGATAEELRKTVLTLQVAQVNGVVEATRFEDDNSFAVMFADLREGIEGTKQALVDVNDISERLHAMADNTPAMAAIISAAVEQMRRDVQALSAVVASTSENSGPAPDLADENAQPAA